MKNYSLTRGLLLIASVAATALLSVQTAHAGTTVYTSRTLFLAALSGPSYTEDFNSLTNNTTVVSGTTFSGNGFAYTVVATGDLFVETINGSQALDAKSGSTPVTFTFTGAPVTAFGGNFFIDNTVNLVNGTVTLAANDGTTFPSAVSGTGSEPFIGFITDAATPFVSVTLSGVRSNATSGFVGSDNVTTGNSTVLAPEPASVAFLLAGLAPLVGMVRARRRSS